MTSFTFKLGSLAVCVTFADIRELLEIENAEAASARVSEPGKKNQRQLNRKESR